MDLHDFNLIFDTGTSFCLENLKRLKRSDLENDSVLIKIFNIFDTQKTNGAKGSDGILDKKELTYLFNTFADLAKYGDDPSTLEYDDLIFHGRSLKTADGKPVSLRKLGITADDMFYFLYKLIDVQNKSLANDLHNDICAKDSFGLPTTGKNIKENVKRINKDNVVQVLEAYKNIQTNKDRQSLISAICEEYGLPADERAEMIQYIENCLLEAFSSKKVYVQDYRKKIKAEIQHQKNKIGPMDGELLDSFNENIKNRWEEHFSIQEIKPADGKVNEVSYQGHTGDCWLIASINSIARSPKGRKILNDSIKVNNDGSVTVHLKGVNKTYTFSEKELYGSKELSTGDMDVRALEKAVERYLTEEKHKDLNGNRAIVAYKILLGESHLDLKGWDVIWDEIVGIRDSYRTKINDPNTICTASVHGMKSNATDEEGHKYIETKSGEKIYQNHAYSVVRADNKYVYLINPWNGGEEIRITFEEFKKIFNSFADVTL